MSPDGAVTGWDIGGAHVKAARVEHGRVTGVVQVACPLWQGLDKLDAAVVQARAALGDTVHHAVTMTGEMVDLFDSRAAGVVAIVERMTAALPGELRLYAGRSGWVAPAAARSNADDIASANWLATAQHAARALPQHEGLLVDIGSTTTDLIAFRRGRVVCASRSDAQRLQTGELVYHGVVRTPLCALARRIEWKGALLNVMNEFFATTADVYRLTTELDPAHDQHPSADNAAKDEHHTRARLARMIGLDERDGSAAQWHAFAQAWREAQLAELRSQVEGVAALHDLAADATVVAAGCGAFLVPELLRPGWALAAYGREVARVSPTAGADVRAWVQVGAPAVAVASLYAEDCA